MTERLVDVMFVAYMGLQTVKHEMLLVHIQGRPYYVRYCLN